jgi:hypothetical protein
MHGKVPYLSCRTEAGFPPKAYLGQTIEAKAISDGGPDQSARGSAVQIRPAEEVYKLCPN